MWISLFRWTVLGRSEATTSSIPFGSRIGSTRSEALPECYNVALAGAQVGRGRILDAGGTDVCTASPWRRNTEWPAEKSGGVCHRTDHRLIDLTDSPVYERQLLFDSVTHGSECPRPAKDNTVSEHRINVSSLP